MSENNGFTVCGFENGCYDVTAVEVIIGKVVVFAFVCLYPFVKSS